VVEVVSDEKPPRVEAALVTAKFSYTYFKYTKEILFCYFSK
jgi:hypothetical protein